MKKQKNVNKEARKLAMDWGHKKHKISITDGEKFLKIKDLKEGDIIYSENLPNKLFNQLKK